MPQFVPNGPVVPDTLVQDLEDDRVVIFCGAGISMGAGLPDYIGLVKHCYNELTHPLPPDDSQEWHWPDRLLGSLESVFTAERVRETVRKKLNSKPRSLVLHRAILRLARLRSHDGMRLVTTNFDTYFERARRRTGIKYDWHAGPVLPIPKDDLFATWRSLVYLHGRLGEYDQQLVLTSADFGRAYLTEAWAARFVARLFADFTVLFVGYSLNDPVLRYMTDAFAAENTELRWKRPNSLAYIFSPYDGDVPPDPQSFRHRNLEPIFYSSTRKHALLKESLVEWANWREDYLSNIGTLISGIAPRQPDAINPTDTANLLWAVIGRTGDQGYGARTFAAVDPLPPIEWLDLFEQRDVEHIATHTDACRNTTSSSELVPISPNLIIEPLFPPERNSFGQALDDAAKELIPWFVRHLGSKLLTDRVLAKLAKGRYPHALLRRAIRKELTKNIELPEGVKRFWWILSAEGSWLTGNLSDAVGPAWTVQSTFENGADALVVRQELLAALNPLLRLKPSLNRQDSGTSNSDGTEMVFGERFSDVASAEIVLTDDIHIQGMIEKVNESPDADEFWAELLDDITSLLGQALHLQAAAKWGDRDSDPSVIERPSIVPHDQNYTHRNWTILFDLIWRGWIYLDANEPRKSRAMVDRWRTIPFLAFRRLAAAAVRHSAQFNVEEKFEVLLGG